MGKKRQPEGGSAEGPGFEESLAQLEAIIERIESGETGLEASIADFERGAALLKRCRAILRQAEQRVEELTRELEADEGAAPGRPGGAGTP